MVLTQNYPFWEEGKQSVKKKKSAKEIGAVFKKNN